MSCAKCQTVFSPTEVFLHVDGRDYHLGCARCNNCGGRIDQRFKRGEREEILCVPCGTPICSRCNQGISGIEVLKAQGKSFHVECFECSVCCSRLQNKYYGDATQPKCSNCELPQCSICRTTIGSGTRYYVQPDGRRPTCVACQSSNMNYAQTTQPYTEAPPPQAAPITVATNPSAPSTSWVNVTADVHRPVHYIPENVTTDAYRPKYRAPETTADVYRAVHLIPQVSADRHRPVHHIPQVSTDGHRPVHHIPKVSTDGYQPVRYTPEKVTTDAYRPVQPYTPEKVNTQAYHHVQHYTPEKVQTDAHRPVQHYTPEKVNTDVYRAMQHYAPEKVNLDVYRLVQPYNTEKVTSDAYCPVELTRAPRPVERQAVTEPYLGPARTKVARAAQMPVLPPTASAYPQSGPLY